MRDILCFQCGKPITQALDVPEDETPCQACLDRLLDMAPPIVPNYVTPAPAATQDQDDVALAQGEDADDRPAG